MSVERLRKRLGDAIRARREMRCISQAVLASRIGFKSRATVSRIEGGTHAVEWRVAIAIAAQLGDPTIISTWWELEKHEISMANNFCKPAISILDEMMAQLMAARAFGELDK